MQLACEFPIHYQEALRDETDFDFLLTHLILEDRRYREFYMRRTQSSSSSCILDCSVFELGVALSAEKVMEAAEIVRPNVIVSPDVLHEASQTAENLSRFLDKYSGTLEKNKWTVAAVLQGKTLKEIEMLHSLYLSIPLISHICIPYDNELEGISELSGDISHAVNRLRVTAFLEEEGLVAPDKNYHLLGCSFCWEIVQQKKHKWITSVDTSAPIVAAMRGINLFEIEEKLKRPANYFEYEYNIDMMFKMNRELRMFKERIN